MNITLTINAETPRELQETIRGLAGSYVPAVPTLETGKPKANARTTKAADKQPEVKDEQPPVIEDKQASVVEDRHETTLTMEEIRAKASALSQSGMQIQVKGLLKKFKVDKLTELSTDQFDEFWEALGGLE